MEDDKQQGLLTVSEIMQLDLNSVDLVVLSTCAAGLVPSKKVTIEYDEKEGVFEVNLTVDGSKSPDEVGLLIRNLPLFIGEKSNCACGSPLRVTNYKIEHNGNDIIFEGNYSCPLCKKRKGSLWAKILNSLSKAWQDTTKVEVSLQGLTYEKQSPEKPQ